MEKTYNPTEGVMIKNAQIKTEANINEIGIKILELALISHARTKELMNAGNNLLAQENDKITDAYILCAGMIVEGIKK